MSHRLSELARLTATELIGPADCEVARLASLSSATPDCISFAVHAHQRDAVRDSRACAFVVPASLADVVTSGLLSEDPYRTYAELSVIFDAKGLPFCGGIDASAQIAPTAVIGAGVSIGAHAVIGDEVVIGEGSIIAPNVTVYPRTQLGAQCIVGANTVLGSDGFGYAKGAHGWIKIRQLGALCIGDRVEIGAGCTIDRGALDDTLIGDDVILDNQVHIAHGCQIGARTAMAGCVALAGSTLIGADVTVGGMTGFTGHLSVCDKVHIGAKALVTQSITVPGAYLGGAGGVMKAADWRRNAVRFRQLDALARRLQALEQRLRH